jgi:hypothetical protein
MEAPAALAAYERFCSDVCTTENGALTVAKYDWMTFEEVFRAITKDAGFNADDLMEEESPMCKTCVCANEKYDFVLMRRSVVFAVNAKNTELQAIRSYRVQSSPNPPFTILQAARATMASPDLFSSVYVGSMPNEKEFVAYFMNPIKSILQEAGKIFKDTTKVACIVSLGSGTKQVEGLPDDPQPDDRMKLLATIAENCETAHQEAASRYGHSGIYHRINVERDQLYTAVNEWDDGFARIGRSTRNFLQANVKSLDRVVDHFVRPVGGLTIRDLSGFLGMRPAL